MITQVYVALLGEGTPAWKPAQARLVENGVYKLLGAPEDGEDWEFKPGQLVACETYIFSSGQAGLVARRSIRPN